MAISINSPEFEKAWKMVSEALLAHIQGGGKININDIAVGGDSIGNDSINSTVGRNVDERKPEPACSSVEQLDVRYAACPIRQTDGSYMFKNLKEECQFESTFKITRYKDGTCEFELCDLQGEARQIFKDNQSERLPSAVGVAIGEISADNRIVNVKPGKGVTSGRSIKILVPLEVEFR